MADLLSTSISGLLAFQRALDTTSHNISNVNTAGYSRQTTDLATRTAEPHSNGWIGQGVDVVSIRRNYDDFIAAQTRSSSSSFQQSDTFATQAGRVSDLLGSATTGISTSLQAFINSMNEVANTPTSTPARQALLSQAQTLVNRLQGYDQSLKSFDAQVDSSLKSEASALSTLASGVAKLNQAIADGYRRTGQPPNDLLDQRDQLIDQISTHVQVSTAQQSDGTVNLFIGNGQPLVVGNQASQIGTMPDPYDATRTHIALISSGVSIDITDSLSGGAIGGALQFRAQMLDPARNSLGQLTVGLADALNSQHHAGIDQNGTLGGDFFGVGGVQALGRNTNTGAETVSVTRDPTATGALTIYDYTLTRTAAGWNLQRADTGASVAMTGTGTASDPFVADDMRIVVGGGAPVTGDRFLIKPTATAISGLQVMVSDPSKVAAAAPIKTSKATANTGNATISGGDVLDATNGALRTTTTIQFLTPTTYSVNGAGSFTYTPGANIDRNGWRVQINGTPAAGDTFTVSDNTAGVGDNRNALKMVDTLTQPILSGGTTSINSAAGKFVAGIGTLTNQAQSTRDAQKIVYDDGVSSQQAVSGVNLDEEAANLLRYQQAYQAAAQMIRVADTLFQTVLQAVHS